MLLNKFYFLKGTLPIKDETDETDNDSYEIVYKPSTILSKFNGEQVENKNFIESNEDNFSVLYPIYKVKKAISNEEKGFKKTSE